ncbi:UNVERIFIED_CONTAM: putative serine/threonine-protein kinase WNK11 [Sesamum calycinum]|uniref:non-specific serine/threonine protein kinase n=1 Tax=Sesamum calycinum TaxID=2727403 RepID=A0AAW2MBS1_9LAMI
MPSMGSDMGDRDRELFVEVDPTGRYGRYSELLGSGAVKKVYRAFDQEEGIEVAWNQVKLRNFSDDETMINRLYSEVREFEGIQEEHRQVSMKALKKWSRQILKGLEYLHTHDPV